MLTKYLGDPKEIITKVPVFGALIKSLDGGEGDYGGFLTLLALAILWFGLGYTDISQAQVFSIVIALSPIWLTWLLVYHFHRKWMDYVGKRFYMHNGRSTLRIKLPPEVLKSPEAMEFVLSQIHNTQNPDNLMQTYLQGKRPLPISLELVSIGGDVRFYINTPTSKTKAAFEANIYAQYPGVEVVEEPVDYLAEIPLDEEGADWEWFSVHVGKRKAEEFPIKTYIDYGLDKLPKEEEKVDPITPMLEVLGAISPGERMFVQMTLISHRKHSFKNGQLILGETETWEKKAELKVDELMRRDPKTKAPLNAGEADFDGSPRVSPGERDIIEAIERNSDKYGYEVGLKFVYAFPAGHFNGDRINPMIRAFSQYDLAGRNTIGVRWRTDFNYKMLKDPFGKKLAALRRQEMKELKLRKYFNKGAGDRPKIFTAEELATMFHLPGQVAITPTLSRVPSKRNNAPGNLPVGNLPT